jgi:hypothetical protein
MALARVNGRRPRYLVAEVATGDGVERITRTLAWDAPAVRVRELLAPIADGYDGWRGGVLVLDPEPGVRLYVLPLIDGALARWDLLLAAHRERARMEAAAEALAAMGHPRGPATQPLAQWLAAGATEAAPAGDVQAYVPPMSAPATREEWHGMERRAQLLARLLPIARDLSPADPLGLAHHIAARLIGER